MNQTNRFEATDSDEKEVVGGKQDYRRRTKLYYRLVAKVVSFIVRDLGLLLLLKPCRAAPNHHTSTLLEHIWDRLWPYICGGNNQSKSSTSSYSSQLIHHFFSISVLSDFNCWFHTFSFAGSYVVNHRTKAIVTIPEQYINRAPYRKVLGRRPLNI